MTAKKSLRALGRWTLGAAAVGFAALAYVYLTLPDVRPLAASNPTTTAFMELRAQEARAKGCSRVTSSGGSATAGSRRNLKRAVLVAEDDAFWQHEGVDFEQLQESLEVDWARGRLVRGGSTITQQLAKNLYLSPSKNPLRKLEELIIARRLEAELKKARIFELYLNVIEWGDGIYGAEAAARTYFRVSAADLGAEPGGAAGGRHRQPTRAQSCTSDRAVAQARAADSAAHGRRLPAAGRGAVECRTGSAGSRGRSENFLRPFSLTLRTRNRIFATPQSRVINYTERLTLLMQDIVARVPALSFIDVADVLVFARSGRSDAEGAFATCHCLSLPAERAWLLLLARSRDRPHHAPVGVVRHQVSRRDDRRSGRSNICMSFALPRFCDQSLDRSRKERFYPAPSRGWRSSTRSCTSCITSIPMLTRHPADRARGRHLLRQLPQPSLLRAGGRHGADLS